MSFFFFIVACVVMYVCYQLGKRSAGVAMLELISMMEQHNIIDKAKWNQLCRDGKIPNYPYPGY